MGLPEEAAAAAVATGGGREEQWAALPLLPGVPLLPNAALPKADVASKEAAEEADGGEHAAPPLPKGEGVEAKGSEAEEAKRRLASGVPADDAGAAATAPKGAALPPRHSPRVNHPPAVDSRRPYVPQPGDGTRNRQLPSWAFAPLGPTPAPIARLWRPNTPWCG